MAVISLIFNLACILLITFLLTFLPNYDSLVLDIAYNSYSQDVRKIMATTVDPKQMTTEEIFNYLYSQKNKYIKKLRFVDSCEADDIFQDAIIRFFKFDRTKCVDINNYFTKILKNSKHSFRKKETKKGIVFFPEKEEATVLSLDNQKNEDVDSYLDLIYQTNQTPDKFLQRKQQLALIDKYMQHLNIQQQRTIDLYYTKDLELIEAAKKLKCSKPYVRITAKIGIDTLRCNKKLNESCEIIDWN